MTRWRPAILAAATLVLATIVLPGAGAKVEPPPLIPPRLPPAATQTLGLVSPVLAAECGTAITALTLLVPAVGGQLAVDPAPLLAGVITICGSVPQPTATLRCGVDDTVSATLVKLLGSLSILLAIVNTRAAAPVAEELGIVDRTAPLSLMLGNVTSLADKALQCAAVARAGPANRPAATNATAMPSNTTIPALSPPTAGAPVPAVAPSAIGATAPSVPQAQPGAAPTTAIRALVTVSAPRGGTPVGSALIGLLLVLAAAAAIAVGLNRAAPGH
ncbi:MAG: hypothetical protein ACYDH6_15490 [Acidimicrobiales bacterium]